MNLFLAKRNFTYLFFTAALKIGKAFEQTATGRPSFALDKALSMKQLVEE